MLELGFACSSGRQSHTIQRPIGGLIAARVNFTQIATMPQHTTLHTTPLVCITYVLHPEVIVDAYGLYFIIKPCDLSESEEPTKKKKTTLKNKTNKQCASHCIYGLFIKLYAKCAHVLAERQGAFDVFIQRILLGGRPAG